MFRALINPLLIATLGVLGFGVCKAGGWNPHTRELLLAAGVCFVAAEMALIPIYMANGKPHADVSQAGLMATVLHMLLAAGLGLGLSSTFRGGQPFMYWLLVFYWTTLVGVAIAAVKAVKSAPVEMPRTQVPPIQTAA